MISSSKPIQAGHNIRGRMPGGLRTRRRGLLAVDLVAAAVAAAAAQLIMRRLSFLDLAVSLLAWLASMVMAGTHASGPLRMRRQAVATIIAAGGLTGFISLVVLGVFGGLEFALIFTAIAFGLALAGRIVLFARMDSVPVGLALLADDETSRDIWPRLMALLGPGYRVEAVLNPNDPRLLRQLISVLAVRPIDEVVLTAGFDAPQLEAALHVCRVKGTRLLEFDNLYEDLTGRCLDPEQRPVVPLPGTVWRTVGSRLVDVSLGLCYLPVWLAGAIVARLTGGARIERLTFAGKSGVARTFPQFAGTGRTGGLASKVLCWGPVMWAPSALHLLRGTLAAVGPSPCRPSELGVGAAWQLRQTVRPGITGWALINGFLPGPDSLAYDLYYVRHRSFGFDLGIFLRAAATPLLSWRALNVALTPSRQEHESVSPRGLSVSTGDDLVSVVVPAFRERGHIAGSLRMLVSELSALGSPFEVIVVSDGNTDGTETEARTVEGPITVIHYPENKGKGYALRRGLSESRGDRVVFIDADMELHPQGISALLSLLDAGADVAIGSKRHADSRVHYPWMRRFQSRAYQSLVRSLFGLNVTDTQTGIKAFRGDLLRRASPFLTNDGFSFDLELLVELTAHGAVIAEGPVTLDYRFRSTTSVTGTIDVLRETLRLWHRRRQSPVPQLEVSAQERL